MQSPIDLRTPGHFDPFPIVSGSKEKFKGQYVNVKNAKVGWATDTIKVQVEASDANPKTQFFSSKYGQDTWMTPDQFNAV